MEFKQSFDRIGRLPTSIVIAAALLTVWLAQGSTFVALKVGVAAVPPFLLSGARFMVVGLTLLIWSAWRAKWHLTITRREAVRAVRDRRRLCGRRRTRLLQLSPASE